MKQVGIKELKTHLSQYVARARAGEHIVVTEHGREVAELSPPSAARLAVISLASEGQLQWVAGKPAGLSGIKPRGKALAQTVLEDRR